MEDALLRASRSGDAGKLERLIANGADVNLAREAATGRTALHLAVEPGGVLRPTRQHETVVMLLDAKADVAATDLVDGDTPLLLATQRGHEKLVELLIDAGANAAARDIHENTSLHHAALWGFQEIADLLLDAGAKPSARNNNESTPLHFACIRGSREAVDVLLGAGADAAASDHLADTPLHAAAKHGDDTMVRLLLDVGAIAAARNSAERTPRFFAEQGVRDLPARGQSEKQAELRKGFEQTAAVLLSSEKKQTSLAFAMGHQERLGAASLVRGLEPELVRMVLDLV